LEFLPWLVRSTGDGGIPVIRLGHPLLDDYLAFVAARARTNTSGKTHRPKAAATRAPISASLRWLAKVAEGLAAKLDRR
jgi:hypothetical protein